jgi:hypothetical protein
VPSVDPLFAQWLQDDALWLVRDDAARKARWGDSAQLTERRTTIATKADAEAEGDRQLAFLGGPLVPEEHLLVGAWAEYLGQVITLTIAKLGYDVGLDVFVLAVADDRAAGLSRVTVLRRL